MAGLVAGFEDCVALSSELERKWGLGLGIKFDPGSTMGFSAEVTCPLFRGGAHY